MPASDETLPVVRGDKPVVESELIHIEAQDSLYEICMENLGRYDAEVLKAIRELNPGFGDPRRIHAGQDVRIPTLAGLQSRANLSVATSIGSLNNTPSYGNASAVEAKKP